MGNVVFVKGDSSPLTYVLTTVGKTSAAGVCNFVSADRTFVACDFDNLDNIGVSLVSAHSELYSFAENSALFINAASHSGGVSRNYDLRNVEQVIKESIRPCLTSDLAKNFVFQVLYFSIKFSHLSLTSYLEINNFNSLTHFLETFGKFFNKIHLDIEVYRKIGVLVRGVHCSAYEEVDIRRLFK